MSSTIELLITQIVSFGTKFFAAAVVLIIGIIIAKTVTKLIKKLLEVIKIDKLGDKLNDIDFVKGADIDFKISAVISKILYYFIVLIFLVIATDILSMQAISDLIADLINFFPKLLTGLVLLVFGVLLSELIRKLVETTLKSIGVASAKLISSFLFYFLFINVVVVAIGQTGINTQFLQQNISIIIAGGVLAFSIGYGLASRDVMANFLSSFYTRDKVAVGDFIELAGEEGEVIEMTKTAITLAANGKKVIYPLKKLLNERVTIIDSKRLNP